MNQTNRTTISLPSDHEILITRVFNARRELVFQAHLDPDLIPRWYGIPETTVIVERLEAYPGGSYRFVTRQPDGSQFAFRGEFREIVAPERIVQTTEFEEMPGHIILETLTFTEQNGQTTLTILETCANQEDRDGILASGMEEGLEIAYQRLEALVIEQSASAR